MRHCHLLLKYVSEYSSPYVSSNTTINNNGIQINLVILSQNTLPPPTRYRQHPSLRPHTTTLQSGHYLESHRNRKNLLTSVPHPRMASSQQNQPYTCLKISQEGVPSALAGQNLRAKGIKKAEIKIGCNEQIDIDP